MSSPPLAQPPALFLRQPAVAHSRAEFPKTFSPKTRKKCLRYFLRGAIMRWLWGRGSVGRAMRSQRIGQGFESPRLHQNPKDTAKSVSFGFLRSRQGSDPRVLGTLSVKENIYSNATRSEMKDPRAGSAAAAADAFARAVARAERPACKSISPVRHLPLWRSSPRHDLPRHRKVGVLRIFA